MICTYIYKGQVFNSEAELNDFLIDKRKFESDFGDLVFSKSAQQLDTLSRLERLHRDTASQKAAWNKDAVWMDGEDISDRPKPYISVTKYITSLTEDDGSPIVPIFIKDNYWQVKKEIWMNDKSGRDLNQKYEDDKDVGVFTEEEMELIFEGNPPRFLTKDEADRWASIIEEKWQQQGAMGTAFHRVLELYFTKNKYGKYNFDGNRDYLVNLAINKTDPKYITKDTIISILNYADAFREQIAKKLNDKVENLEFLSETKVMTELSQPGPNGETQLVGSIDLTVVDSKGVAHIFDFKTSPKSYAHYSSAKKLTFNYQQAIYRRMLQRNKINVVNNTTAILPVEFKDLNLTNRTEALLEPKKAKFSYSGFEFNLNDVLVDLTPEINVNDKINANIDYFAPKLVITDAPSEEVIKKVSERYNTFFPGSSRHKSMLEEQLKQELQDAGAFNQQDNGTYVYRLKGSGKEFVTNSEAEMFKEVQEYYEEQQKKTVRRAEQLIKALEVGQNANTTDIAQELGRMITQTTVDGEADVNWFIQYVQQYCNGDWKVEPTAATTYFGIVPVRNIHTNQVDFIKISARNLNYHNYFKQDNKRQDNRGNLTYGFEPDIVEDSNSNSLMLKAYTGNLEAMEVMMVINEMSGSYGAESGTVIGKIQIANPYNGQAMSAKNKEYIYSYKRLASLAEKGNKALDFISSNKIRFASEVDILENDLVSVLSSNDSISGKNEFLTASNELRSAVDVEEKIKALELITRKLVEKNRSLGGNVVSSFSSKEARLYNRAMVAIADLKGLSLRQQVEDHGKWSDTAGIWETAHKGHSGSYLDNAGTLRSGTLNLLTRLVTNAYNNIRHYMAEEIPTIRKMVEDVKSSQGFGLGNRMLGNVSSLYTSLIDHSIKDDLVMLNPDDPASGITDPNLKKFAKYFLEKVNSQRYGNLPKSEIEKMRVSGDRRYYQIPLMMGDSETQIAMKGVGGWFKETLGSLTPENAIKRMRAGMEGIFESDKALSLDQGENLFHFASYFDRGLDQNSRRKAILENGRDFFSTNLELVLLKHEFAYASKKHINKAMPMIKATMIHLRMQGESQNTMFRNDIEYGEDYIKAIVKNTPITDSETGLKTKAVIDSVKKVTSFVSLAFSPLQMYQFITHLWTDISLAIRKPDGTQAFSFRNFRKAFKIVYKDLLHFSETPTKVQLINELYGINDMDMNTYVDRIRSEKGGLFNINNLAFKFASRPDYYGRMSIIVAKMIEDGTWDAYDVVDGKLVYNFKADKRFEAFANGNKSHPKYNEQKALYYAIRKQLVNENFVMPDGREYNPKGEEGPLPTPYSSVEVESMKNITDVAYGYYTHERKSLLHYTMLGGLAMQMKTYWSGKKQQYLQPGGCKVQGKWEQAQDAEGNMMYYQTDENGNILQNEPPTTNDTGVPFMVWKGRFEEGIIVTFAEMARYTYEGVKDGDGLFTAMENAWARKWGNEDLDIQRAARSNMKQIVWDIFVSLVVGHIIGGMLLLKWAEEEEKDSRKNPGDLDQAFIASGALILSRMVSAAGGDFAFWNSIGNPIISWTPFSLESTSRLISNWWSVFTGDKNTWGGIANTFTATKVFKPVFRAIHPLYSEDKK